MKKTILLMCAFAVSFCHLYAQKYAMTAPEGYGAGTTGGGSATPITVSTYSALKSALTGTTPAVILVSGTIDFNAGGGMIKMAISNKTIIGLPGAKFVNTNQTTSGIFYLEGASTNVIFRNILFEGPGARDNNGNDNLTLKPATKVWVDHCEFQDGEDGNLDVSGNSDNITVSWCKFTYLKATRPAGPNGGTTGDHRFSNLIGGSDSDRPTDLAFSVTWQNCYWGEGCRERMPRARNSQLHMLNCYYNTSISGAVALGLGGGAHGTSCYVENCHFDKVTNTFKSYAGTPLAVTFSGNINGFTNVGAAVAKPSYTTSSFPVADVKSAITGVCGAGPTLKVSATGVVSSACFETDLLSDNLVEGASIVYPNPSAGSFTVKVRETIKTLTIINSAGTTVYTKENIQSGVGTEIAADLTDGLYFVKLQNVSGSTEMIKFIKTK